MTESAVTHVRIMSAGDLLQGRLMSGVLPERRRRDNLSEASRQATPALNTNSKRSIFCTLAWSAAVSEICYRIE